MASDSSKNFLEIRDLLCDTNLNSFWLSTGFPTFTLGRNHENILPPQVEDALYKALCQIGPLMQIYFMSQTDFFNSDFPSSIPHDFQSKDNQIQSKKHTTHNAFDYNKGFFSNSEKPFRISPSHHYDNFSNKLCHNESVEDGIIVHHPESLPLFQKFNNLSIHYCTPTPYGSTYKSRSHITLIEHSPQETFQSCMKHVPHKSFIAPLAKKVYNEISCLKKNKALLNSFCPLSSSYTHFKSTKNIVNINSLELTENSRSFLKPLSRVMKAINTTSSITQIDFQQQLSTFHSQLSFFCLGLINRLQLSHDTAASVVYMSAFMLWKIHIKISLDKLDLSTGLYSHNNGQSPIHKNSPQFSSDLISPELFSENPTGLRNSHSLSSISTEFTLNRTSASLRLSGSSPTFQCLNKEFPTKIFPLINQLIEDPQFYFHTLFIISIYFSLIWIEDQPVKLKSLVAEAQLHFYHPHKSDRAFLHPFTLLFTKKVHHILKLLSYNISINPEIIYINFECMNRISDTTVQTTEQEIENIPSLLPTEKPYFDKLLHSCQHLFHESSSSSRSSLSKILKKLQSSSQKEFSIDATPKQISSSLDHQPFSFPSTASRWLLSLVPSFLKAYSLNINSNFHNGNNGKKIETLQLKKKKPSHKSTYLQKRKEQINSCYLKLYCNSQSTYATHIPIPNNLDFHNYTPINISSNFKEHELSMKNFPKCHDPLHIKEEDITYQLPNANKISNKLHSDIIYPPLYQHQPPLSPTTPDDLNHSREYWNDLYDQYDPLNTI